MDPTSLTFGSVAGWSETQLTDKNGSTFQLTGDAAKFGEHAGHEVKVSGTSSSASTVAEWWTCSTTQQPSSSQATQVTRRETLGSFVIPEAGFDQPTLSGSVGQKTLSQRRTCLLQFVGETKMNSFAHLTLRITPFLRFA
jgi:hypothetical protein